MHNMLMTPSNKEATQHRMTPGQMTHEPTMMRELNGWNLLHSLHNQMCRPPPRYRCHVAEHLLYLIPYVITLLTI
jgi:hypothetical protein